MTDHIPDHVQFRSYDEFVAGYRPGPWSGTISSNAAALQRVLAGASERVKTRSIGEETSAGSCWEVAA